MAKIAFLFPGQGSQYPGMGKDFFESSEKIRNLYAEAEEVLKSNLKEKIFSGTLKDLKDTGIAQPAILLNSVVCYRMLKEENIVPKVMAGHSLGEYSALVSAGVCSFKDALRIVRKRSLWMAEVAGKHPGKMAAVIGLSAEEVEEICRETKSKGVISPANFNSPRQTVISGEVPAVEAAERLAKERGARRVVILPVSGPFHTELMDEAGEKLRDFLDSVEFRSPEVPILSNVTAKFETEPAQIKENLVKQVSQPVRWTDSIMTLFEQGFNVFVEAGPKRVLSGLLTQFEPKATILNVEDRESLERTKKVLIV